MYQFLDRITVTGADDSVDPHDLFPLAERFPFLEFGILLSKKQIGGARFPSLEWQRELAKSMVSGLRISGHLCGEYVRAAYQGDFLPVTDDSPLWTYFDRLQLNTHGQPHATDLRKLIAAIQYMNAEGRQIIFQLDGANTDTLRAIRKALPTGDISALHDLSHGGGRLPQTWKRQFPGYCGYAGGLSPENVADHLERIEAPHYLWPEDWPIEDCQPSGPGLAWIDAETHLFSGGRFDLDRVRKFVERAEPWIKR